MTNDFQRLAPAMTWIDVNVAPGTRHVALPSDVFTITVYCNEGFMCLEEGEDFEPSVLLTPLRSRPGRFLSGGHGELVLAILTPEALIRALRAPLQGLTDRRIPLEQLCGRREQRQLQHQLMAASTRAERIERIGRWIESRITGRHALDPAQTRVVRATNMMLQDGWDFDVERLASDLDVTRRQMQRDFDHWLGTSPSHYARLIRFQRASAAIAQGAPIVDAALNSGYADQSHLTRSARQLAGSTPRAMRQDSHREGRLLMRAAMADRLLIGEADGVIFGAAAPSAAAAEHALVVRPAAAQRDRAAHNTGV